jgi:hypothetical protein
MQAMPAAMVNTRLRLTIATPAATAAANHSLGPPDRSETETSDTSRQPGKAFKALAQAPSRGTRCPSKMPDRRIVKVATIKPPMTSHASGIGPHAGNCRTRDATENESP